MRLGHLLLIGGGLAALYIAGWRRADRGMQAAMGSGQDWPPPAPGFDWPSALFGGAAVATFFLRVLEGLARQNEGPAAATALPQDNPPTAMEGVAPAAPWPPAYQPPPDAQWLRLAPHPCVILVLGKRGADKSALGYRLLELYRDRATPYVVGLPATARRYLPDWVGLAERLEDVPPGSIVLVDESYLAFHARSSMSEAGRAIGGLVNLSRQRRHTLIFIVQEVRELDVNIVSQADVLAIKELSELSRDFERPGLRRFTDRARAALATVEGDRRRWTWVHSEPAGWEGLVEKRLPSFWREGLSHAFAGAVQGLPPAGPRKGKRTPKEELTKRARGVREASHSCDQIARALSLPKSTVWDLVNPDRG